MVFKKLDLFSEDLAGKDINTDLGIDPESVRLFDLNVINQVNEIIKYYMDEIQSIEEMDYVEYEIFKLNDITAEYIAKRTYEAVIKKTLADIELLYHIGFTIFSNYFIIFIFINNCYLICRWEVFTNFILLSTSI